MYNVYMMEEVQTIFAIGAGAVTKLVDYRAPGEEGKTRIKRIFREKYPYEYLREHERRRTSGVGAKPPLLEAAVEFFSEDNN